MLDEQDDNGGRELAGELFDYFFVDSWDTGVLEP